MKRTEFLKACLVGVSSCAACGLGAFDGAGEQDPLSGQDAAVNTSIDGIRIRYAALVGAIGRHVPEDTQRTIFREVGRECARQFKGTTYEKYAGNLGAFLDEARGPNGWMASADYDRTTGVITIVDRSKSCTCPLVKRGLTPAAQCECTLGWQEETYSRILGRPVKASLAESILRGDSRCVFRIQT
ncbi:MAG TPA: hypothetical protein VF147_18870 [Vicinamibacterales bacterium]